MTSTQQNAHTPKEVYYECSECNHTICYTATFDAPYNNIKMAVEYECPECGNDHFRLQNKEKYMAGMPSVPKRGVGTRRNNNFMTQKLKAIKHDNNVDTFDPEGL